MRQHHFRGSMSYRRDTFISDGYTKGYEKLMFKFSSLIGFVDIVIDSDGTINVKSGKLLHSRQSLVNKSGIIGYLKLIWSFKTKCGG